MGIASCGDPRLYAAGVVGASMALAGVITLASSALSLKFSVTLLTVGSIITSVALTILLLPRQKELQDDSKLKQLTTLYNDLKTRASSQIKELQQQVALLTKEKQVQEIICAQLRLAPGRNSP